jgi:RNA polymerase sigma factor (sigma-70 family)
VTLRPFEDVVGTHGQMVMRICAALVPAVDAEDAWSETFLAALRAYPRLRPNSNVAAWLATIAHRKAIDILRDRRPVAPVIPDVPVLDPELPDLALGSALADLPDKQRGAVVYRYLADLPYSQVATLLSCTEAAARRSAADGVARLRRLHKEGAF